MVVIYQDTHRFYHYRMALDVYVCCQPGEITAQLFQSLDGENSEKWKSQQCIYEIERHLSHGHTTCFLCCRRYEEIYRNSLQKTIA